MENAVYCPKCGHAFVQGESDYSYDDGQTHYSCPDCDWVGTQDGVMNIDNVLCKLEDLKNAYELGGVELTEEDAQNVIKEVTKYGETFENAMANTLAGIRKVLDEGIE